MYIRLISTAVTDTTIVLRRLRFIVSSNPLLTTISFYIFVSFALTSICYILTLNSANAALITVIIFILFFIPSISFWYLSFIIVFFLLSFAIQSERQSFHFLYHTGIHLLWSNRRSCASCYTCFYHHLVTHYLREGSFLTKK